jgi:NADH-quinone oxidoreductase subunit N
MSINATDLNVIMPFLICFLGALAVVVGDLMAAPQGSRSFLGVIAGVALLVAGSVCMGQLALEPRTAFGGMMVMDSFAAYLGGLFCGAGFLAILIMMAKMPEHGVVRGETYALMLISTAGAHLLAGAQDLVILFIALECLSIPAYIMAAALRNDHKSVEAGMKYFVLGSFASGFIAYGIALIYGFAGSTSFSAVAGRFHELGAASAGLVPVLGMSFLLLGFFFKIAAVPFHMWTPDVYEGAPTSVTTYYATVVKAAAFGVLVRVLFQLFAAQRAENPLLTGALGWYQVVIIISILTMTAGNLLALVQSDVKRMLAYSSISHAGYLMIGLIGQKQGIAAILFYLMAYTFMTIGAFALLAHFERQNKSTKLSDYTGMGRTHPLSALGMMVFMVSLAGVPPTAGFMGKFYLFRSALLQGEVLLVILAVINSVISAAYYLRVVIVMFMQDRTEGDGNCYIPISLAIVAVVLICLIGVMGMGLAPSSYLDSVALAVRSF